LAIVYKHTQIGYVILASFGTALALLGVLAVAYGSNPIQWFVSLVLIVFMVLFATLTIQVHDGMLRASFGPGLIRKTVLLERIAGCAPVRNPWYYGWGIRITPDGLLYNVSGTRAVEIILTDGSKLRLGTDEPEALCRAIQSWLPASTPMP
jgi:hypothetical protein